MFNHLRIYILKSLKNKKLNVFGLFLILSFIILVITKLSESYVETIPFKVSYKNLPENMIITLDSTPQIDVTVSTHGFNLLSYYFSKPEYTIDVEKCSKLNNDAYLWLAEKGSYDFNQIMRQSVNIVSITPDSLELPYGILATKKVPLILRSDINFESGYNSLQGFVLEPDSVKVIGAEEDIKEIMSIQTALIEFKKLKSDINQTVKFDLQNISDKIKLSEQSAKLTARVEKFTEGIVDIPVTIINKPSDIELNYFPKQIKVSYYVRLKDYKDIKSYDFK
ncbi:MAG: YbbR-like domain-containing protein, partial [Psychroserpens sp.]|nr:YbbR-like domain-containing protein [Psychroserpens sp.]